MDDATASRLRRELDTWTDRIVTAQPIARALVAARKNSQGRDMAGGKFFALVDELDETEKRLDALAEPLLEKLKQTEQRASRAVEGRHAKLDAANDYIKRLDGVVAKIEEGNEEKTNGGPTVTDSENSSESSADAKPVA